MTTRTLNVGLVQQACNPAPEENLHDAVKGIHEAGSP